MKSFLLSTIKIDFKSKGIYDSDAIHFQIDFKLVIWK